MKGSFRRMLALRFAGTMAVGMAALSVVCLSPPSIAHLWIVHAFLVLAATGATLIGSWVVAGWAVRPVDEIVSFVGANGVTRIEDGVQGEEDVVCGDRLTIAPKDAGT